VSGSPWSKHGERQVQNEVAWPMTASSRRWSSPARDDPHVRPEVISGTDVF
jgi:hypothetical protein